MKTSMGTAEWDSKPLQAASLAEQTAQQILDAICDGKLREEDSFPSQFQLGEQFGVSRTVVREATQILVSKGILDVQHGKRITIKPPSHEQISESVSLAFRRKGVTLLDVLELRKVIEVEAAAFAAARATADDLETMAQSVLQMEKQLDSESGYVDADVAFHTALFAAAKQPAFELVLTSLSDYLVESRRVSYRGDTSTKRALRAHKEILEEIKNKNETGARMAMRKHLDETQNDLMHGRAKG